MRDERCVGFLRGHHLGRDIYDPVLSFEFFRLNMYL